jgi:hypothetical protein
LPVTEIASYAFKDKSINRLIVGSNIKIIGSYAFYCSRIKTITWGEKLETIQSWAFYENSITQLVLPDSVKGIGYSAFAYGRSLQSVSVGNGVTGIADNAFAWCFNLRSFSYRGSVEEWKQVSVNSWFAQETAFTYISCSDGSVSYTDPGDGAD